jgi:hypothetical protein
VSTVQRETMQTDQTEPRRDARGLRRYVAGIVAASVLTLVQASTSRSEGPFGIDSDGE